MQIIGRRGDIMRKANSMDMCNGPLFKKIILYTVPIILASILQLFFNAADLIVVGRYAGSISVAAVGATGAIINLTVCLFIGLSLGAGVVVAQGLGAKNSQQVESAVHSSILMALVGGVVLTFIGVFSSRGLLRLMGTPDDVIELSVTYMQIYFCGIIPMLVYNFGSAILRAVGDTKSPLVFLSVAGIINVVLNVFFVRNLHLGVAGVALATTISQTVSAILIVISLARRTDDCRLDIRRLRFSKRTVGKIIQIGVPSGIQSAMFSVANVLIQSSVNSLGGVVIAGEAAAKNIEGFLYVSMNAFHQTSMNFAGQNMGAGKLSRVKKTLLICAAAATVLSVILSIATNLFGRQLLSLYIVDSPEAIDYGMIRIVYTTALYFLCALMEVLTGTLRGMGASLMPMLISVFGICGVRIIWVYTFFSASHTLQSLSISYPVSWLVTSVLQFAAFIYVMKKYEKRLA